MDTSEKLRGKKKSVIKKKKLSGLSAKSGFQTMCFLYSLTFNFYCFDLQLPPSHFQGQSTNNPLLLIGFIYIYAPL